MRFFIAFFAAALILGGTAAQATPSRAVALGDLGLYIEDDTNVLRYPGLLGKNTNFVYVDLGGPSGLRSSLTGTQQAELNGGAFLRLTDEIKLGVVASDFAPGVNRVFLRQVANSNASPNADVFNALADDTALRRYDLILGFQASKEFGAGLRVAYGSESETYVPDSKSKTTPADPSKEPGQRLIDRKGQSHLQLAGGVSGALGDAGYYDFALEYGHYGFTYDKNDVYAFVAGGHEIGASARARIILSKFWDLVPQISYRGTFMSLTEDGFIPEFGSASNGEFEPFPNDASRVHERSNHVVDMGVAGVLRANELANLWLAAGVLVQSDKVALRANKIAPMLDEERSTTLYSLPYIRFAVEGTPLEWLQLRVGVEKFAWRASTDVYVNDKEAEKEFSEEASGAVPTDAIGDFQAYVGASFLLKGFQLDLLLDREFFRRGPSIISGAAGNLSGRATLSYRF